MQAGSDYEIKKRDYEVFTKRAAAKESAQPKGGLKTQADTSYAGKSPQELLDAAAKYEKYGPDYDRNIATSANQLRQNVERNSKFTQLSADELAVRLDAYGPKKSEPTAESKPTAPEVAPPAKETSAGPKVTATPAQEHAVSQLADKKQLKVQKEFLGDAIKNAIKDAPEEITYDAKGEAILNELDSIVKERAAIEKPMDRKVFSPEVVALAKKAGLKGSARLGQPADALIDDIRNQVTNEHGGKLTIDVPGDGRFRITHTKDALTKFGEVVRKGFGNKLGPHPVDSTMSAKAPGIPPVDKAPAPADITKAVSLSQSKDETRVVLNRTVQDGKYTIATDGRRLTIGVGGDGEKLGKDRYVLGKDGKPITVVTVKTDPKTKKETRKVDKIQYPNWRRVVPTDMVELTPSGLKLAEGGGKMAINTEVDTGETLRLARLASLATSEKSNSLEVFQTGDGKIGFAAQDPVFGEYHSEGTEGLNPDGTPKTAAIAVDPDFLIDALTQARAMGHDKIRLIVKDEVSPMVVTDGKKFANILMPVRLSSLSDVAAKDLSLEHADQMSEADLFGRIGERADRITNGERAPSGIPTEAASAALKEWQDKNPKAPKVRLVNDPDWKENGRGVRGQYQNGELVVNAAYAPDAAAIHEIANHEWAHDTLASKDGRLAIATFATRELPRADLDALKVKYPQQPGESVVDHRLRLTEEWVAKNAEKNPGVWTRIVDAVKGWLEKRGLATLTNEQAARAMLRALRGKEGGEPTPTPPPTEGSPVTRSSLADTEKDLKEARDKVVSGWKNIRSQADLKAVMSADRDAVDTKANAYSREVRNTVADSLTRAFGKKDGAGVAADALSFHIEAGGKDSTLRDFRDKIAASTKVDPKWQARALSAIDYALAHGNELKPVADQYRKFTNSQQVRESDAGLPTLKRDNYVPHFQDVEEGGIMEHLLGGNGTSPTGAANRKNRVHETFADSLAAGVDPKSLNAVDALETRVRTGETGINMRAWQKALPSYKDAKGEAIARTPDKVERADASVYYEPGKGYTLENVGNTPVAVKKEYSGIVSALTDPSWFSQNQGRLAVQKLNAAAKSITLAVDTFHLGRLAFRSAMIRAASVTNPKFGPAYKEGLLVSEHSPAEIIRMGNSGEIPKESVPALLENKKIIQKLTDVGYNSGRVADAMHQELIQKIPILGDVNKFIFQKFQRGAMNDAGVLEYKRQRAAYPEMSDEQVARKVSKELMTRFGNLGRQGWFKSQTAQDVARLMVLAPEWNQGLIRSELGGITDMAKAAGNTLLGRRAAMGLLGREMVTTGVSLFAASQIINQITRGKFTWENPEEGTAAKISAFIPDKLGGGSGFFLNPMGLTAETGHLLLNAYERTGNTYEPVINYMRSRASAVTRPAWTFLTGKDALGRNLKPEDHWKETAKDAIPAPISGGAAIRAAKGLTSAGMSEKFPGEYQKQAMQSFGVRTELAPGPEKRIRSLATEFNRAHGIQPSGEYYAGKFSALTDALRRQNKGDVENELGALFAQNEKPTDIEKYYREWQHQNYAGSAVREQAFIRSLNPEQKQQYAQARQERTRLAVRAMQAIRALPAAQRRPNP